jgi:hypothetical protein
MEHESTMLEAKELVWTCNWQIMAVQVQQFPFFPLLEKYT